MRDGYASALKKSLLQILRKLGFIFDVSIIVRSISCWERAHILAVIPLYDSLPFRCSRNVSLNLGHADLARRLYHATCLCVPGVLDVIRNHCVARVVRLPEQACDIFPSREKMYFGLDTSMCRIYLVCFLQGIGDIPFGPDEGANQAVS